MQAIDFKTVPASELRKNPWNTNRVSADHELKIRKSLERNGMFKPIIVRQFPGVDGYEILGGEHRWEQAVELGYTEVPIANLGFIDDRRAKEIGVIDNTRYGADDTLSFADLLKEIGDLDELQDFLPYGSADLDAIFSSSDISLEELDLPGNLIEEEETQQELPAEKAQKTHQVMRFKIPLGDAERLTALIASTKNAHGYKDEDDLTNAGDALIHLIASQLPAAGDALERLEEALKENEA